MIPLFPLFSLRQRPRFDRPRSTSERRPRTNDQIRAPKVLLVTDDGAKEMTVPEALVLAQEQGLDLIEVSPKANPPVVKIEDIGKFLYQVQKKEKKQRSHSKQVEVKMLRFGFRTDKHDIERLADRAKEFFTERHLVKFVVRLRGRELANKDYAIEKLKNLLISLQDVSDVEQEIKRQGDQFIAILRPKK